MKSNLLFFRLFLLLLFLFQLKVQAQDPNLVWAKSLGGTNSDLGQAIATDAAGNVYTIGYFAGTADFDPNAGVFNLTSVGGLDIFVCKLDADGNLVWAKNFGGTSDDTGQGIATDAAGNVYTTGFFQGTVDFDPNAGVTNLTSAGSYDIFVSKLDAAGNLVWAKNFGGTSADVGGGISVDATGNVYTAGYFAGTADFDPNAGVSNLTSADGSYDVFISKLDAAGNLVWAKAFGGTANDFCNDISVDAVGNVYTTGQFIGTADFDPNAGVFDLTSVGDYDVFVHKMSTPAASLNFDGINDKVVIGNTMNTILASLNTITVEAWVNPTNTTFNGVIIGNYYNSTNTEMQFLLRRDFNTFSFWVNDGTGFKTVDSGLASVVVNTWQHVAGVWDGSSIYIYVDGVLKGTTTGVTGSNFAFTNNDIVLGNNSYPEPFAGSIDELKIWNRALNQCEIQNNINGELSAGQTGLLAYYQFNQGIASADNTAVTSLTDSSGNNYNGTLTNFALTGTTSNWVSPGGVITNSVSPTYNTPNVNAVTSQSVCNNSLTTPFIFSSSTTGTACGQTNEGGTITLTAPVGAVFTSIPFASYGTPNGTCGNYTFSGCHASNSNSVVSALAIGQNNFSILADNGTFGDPCNFTAKYMYIQAVYNNTTFNWTNDTSSIGLATSGTGNIPSFSAVNTGSTPVVATIIVTPVIDGCAGTPIQFTITVNPTPTEPAATSQEFCNNATVADLSATGISLNWYDVATNGTALSASTALTTGTYYVSQTINTCESLRTAVSVIITPSSENVTTITACDSYTWSNDGQTYTMSGIYTGTTTNCVTEKLDLTIISIDNTVSELTTGVLTANETGAIYQWYECPNTLLMGETNQDFTPTIIGDYKVEVTVGSCMMESNCVTVTTLGTVLFDEVNFKYYPNPTSGIVNIFYSREISEVTVMNLIGQTVLSQKGNNLEMQLDLSKLAASTYLVKVVSEGQSRIIKVVKQ